MSHRRLAAALALLAAGGTASVLIFARDAPSKPPPAPGTPAAGTATVERHNLVATDTAAGTLSYAAPQTVYNRLSGTITWLPRVGQTIRPGGVLFRVDGRPVILMGGTTPAYRSLAPGIGRGADVLQLNRDLAALGFDPEAITIDEEWQSATTAGVEQLQHRLGEAETGTLAFGQVVFLPGTQLVSTVDATLGGDGGSASPSTGSASDHGQGGREYASLEEPASTRASTTPTTAPGTALGTRQPTPGRDGLRALEAQVARLKREVNALRSQSSRNPAGSGEPAGNGSPSSTSGSQEPGGAATGSGGVTPTPILATTSTRIVVKVALEANKRKEAAPGEAVTVALPDGEEVAGTVTAVSAIAQTSSGNPSAESGTAASSTIPVTVILRGRHTGAGLDQAPVSVNFVQAVARDVLSVPVTALVATGGAHYAVQEAAPPHRVLPVRTGLFAAGEVQVSGAGIHPGLLLSDSQG